MPTYLRDSGLPGLLVVGFLWYVRRNRRIRRERILKKRGNNGEPVNSPDNTSAEAQLITNEQNIELYVRRWRAHSRSRPRGVVLLIHSYSWHSAYFLELADMLTARRFGVVTYDQQGHGLSGTGTRCRGDVHQYEDLINDAEQMIQYCKVRYPNLPLFVFGDGFGATIALHLTLRQEGNIHGVVLCGPMVMTAHEGNPPLFIRPILMALEKIHPRMKIANSEALDTIVHGKSDPLLIHRPTIRFFIQVRKCLQMLESNLVQIRVPFLTLHGNLDTRARSTHSRELFGHASSMDKSIKVYEHMYSRLLFESPANKERVFLELTSWMQKKVEVLMETTIAPAAGSSQRGNTETLLQAKMDMSLRRDQQKIMETLDINGF